MAKLFRETACVTSLNNQTPYCFNSGSNFNMFLFILCSAEVFNLEPADVICKSSQIAAWHIHEAVKMSSAKMVKARKTTHCPG